MKHSHFCNPSLFDSPRKAFKGFFHLPLIEEALGAYLKNSIVLSTSWREESCMEVLLGSFSKDVALRVIGATPSMVEDRCGQHSMPIYEEPRQAEVPAWL